MPLMSLISEFSWVHFVWLRIHSLSTSIDPDYHIFLVLGWTMLIVQPSTKLWNNRP